MKLHNSKGNTYETRGEKGKGGQAAVYKIVGRPELLAKNYFRPRTGEPGEREKLRLLAETEEKLKFMRDNPPDDPGAKMSPPHVSIAWPVDVTYDGGGGKFVGYLMGHITDALPLIQAFNPVMRARVLPGFDWRYLHRVARNLAAALNALHAKGYVVGDLNESNVLVNSKALVTVIDCDSFQVQTPSKLYACPVGKPEYTAPEIQGRSFKDTARTPNQDNFALAVLVYQLLMNGNHPFRSQWLGSGDPPAIEYRISKGWFPYLKDARSWEVAVPPNVPKLGRLHPRVSELIRHCFVDGHIDSTKRPTAAEWESALSEAEKAVTLCTKKGHLYSNHLPECPHCSKPCPRCGAPLQLGWGFCGKCGTKV